MKKHNIVIAAVSALLMATGAQAADKSPWKSTVEFGFIRTTGNTETQTAAVKADATYEVDKWRHQGHAEAYGQQGNNSAGQSVVSAERYEASAKSDYKFSDRDYIYGLVKLQKDRFSGFEYEHNVNIGYGHKAIKRADMELDLELAPGVRFFKPDNQSGDNEALLSLAGKYWWQISDHSKFTQDLFVDIGESFTTTKSVTGIQANISSALAMKISYTIRNKSKVPAGVERTDTELGATLVYAF